eukprot:TRINITY_DN31814_c0_g1_i1.p1 TRINITY_DN31814_c0_g1~~TRINITY_DN31814_c0_g1_i1.p1  ORF type:complete len:694 (+),score=126.50 TRINITY_DN31814_c0_g1_i1:44-2125(+)
MNDCLLVKADFEAISPDADYADDADVVEADADALYAGDAAVVDDSVPNGAAGSAATQGMKRTDSRSRQCGPAPTFNSSHCMYDVVVAAAEMRGWRAVKNEAKASGCNVHWIDDGLINDWLRRTEPWMRINHFPGMHNALARKSRLARNMNRVQRLFPTEYKFITDTWVLPDDIHELQKVFEDTRSKAKTIYIAKPDAGTQGRGIFLASTFDRIKKGLAERDGKDNGVLVVQRYIGRPMLIEGMKFDLRLYLLVAAELANAGTTLEPRFFLFRDGLVRLCTTEYEAPTEDNLHQKRMHLTNYAINKKSKDFVHNENVDDDGAGSKRSLRWFLDFVAEQHGDDERAKLWSKLKGLCVKMLLAVWPTLEAEYFGTFPRDLSAGAAGCRAFEVLGVDVMLDFKRRPFLIEINHLPSFTCDAPLDEDVKSRVVQQALDLTCKSVSSHDKQAYESAVAVERSGARGVAGAESEDARSPCAQQQNPSPLECAEYKDFERVYPAPANASKLAARYEAIFSRMRESFRPVLAAAPRRRPASASCDRRGSTQSQGRGGAQPALVAASAAAGAVDGRTSKPGPANAAGSAAAERQAAPNAPSAARFPPRIPASSAASPPAARSAVAPAAPHMAPASAHLRLSRSAPPPRSSSRLSLPAVSARTSSPTDLVERRSQRRETAAVPRRRPELSQRQAVPMGIVQIGL